MSATNLSKIERREIIVQHEFAQALSEQTDFPAFLSADGGNRCRRTLTTAKKRQRRRNSLHRYMHN